MLRKRLAGRQIVSPREIAAVGSTLVVELSTTQDGKPLVLVVGEPDMIRRLVQEGHRALMAQV